MRFFSIALAVALMLPLSANAQTYEITTCLERICGDANGDGNVTAVDALVAQRAAITLPPRLGACEWPVTDNLGLDSTVVMDNTAVDNETTAHGTIFFPDGCGDMDGSVDTTATDALAILLVAIGAGYSTNPRTCDMLFTDQCGTTSDIFPGPIPNVAANEETMDKLGQGDGIVCSTFERVVLDQCDAFTNRFTCEASNFVGGRERRHCRWIDGSNGNPFIGCFPKEAIIDRCLQAQRDGGIN